jgi:pyridoxal phosphate enzyme (YggS family)
MSESHNIGARVRALQEKIAAAAVAAGRDPASVALLAASKTQSVEAIQEALVAGQTLLGENRAQSLRDKAPRLASHSPAPSWHFIGRLQKNKIKYVVPWARLIHTVDSLALAQAIGAKTSEPIGVLIQVNTGNDPAKGGVAPSTVLTLAEEINQVKGVHLRGLMTIPPFTDDPDQATPFFEELAALAEAGRARGLPLHELSMGMSGDFHQAIAAGSTIVRIGTAIFGARARP